MQKAIIIAGPCAAESKEQLFQTARGLTESLSAKGLALDFFRAGVWKPRSKPGDFSGIGTEALPWLQELQQQFGIPVCVEVGTPDQLDLCEQYDIKACWIGARTSVNPFDVQAIADAAKNRDFTIMVKNPMVADLKLWIGNIERFLNAGITKLMAVHRGCADSNESVYRNNPSWEMAIDLKVRYPQIPLLCDPSHIAGQRQYIAQLSQLALDYGFDGLMIEAHYQPSAALSDAEQQLTPADLTEMLSKLQFKDTITSPAEHELRKQRTLIHNIDTQLSVLLGKRMEIVDSIAKIKAEHNLPVVQPEQWNKVVQTYQQNSLQDIDYQNFIENFLELLHQSSIKRQRK